MIPDHPSLAKAVRSQMAIGTRLLPRGFISLEWLKCLKDFGVQEQPEQKLSKLLRLIWFDFTDTLWRNRNEVAHSRDSRTQQLEQGSWASKLRWYLENRHVISPRDQFVLSYTREGIETMPNATRRQWVKNLTRLERIFAVEQRARVMGQGTLWSFFRMSQGTQTSNTKESAKAEQVDTNTTKTM
jgi:hypothetical protein